MKLSPLDVYNRAVGEIPSLKFALGVAGVVAMALVAYNLAHDSPLTAIYGFVFTLAGMYLLMVFASIGDAGQIVRRPFILVVWAVTLAFVAFLLMTMSAFMLGWPPALAERLGAIPAFGATDHPSGSISPELPTTEAKPATPERGPSVAPPPEIKIEEVSETFEYEDRSNNCAIDRMTPVRSCLPEGSTVTGWGEPRIASANCGSGLSNIRRDGQSCVVVDVRLTGCGYDNILGIKNCKGRGWVHGFVTVTGTRPSTS